MKKLLTTLFLALLSMGSYAQEFDFPKSMVMETEGDFTSFESKVLEAIAWRANTPVNTQVEKRKKVNAFLLQWMSGTPTVSILVNSKVGAPFMDDPEYLMSYMVGWTEYSITHNHSKDDKACAKAAVLHVIDFYEKNKDFLNKRGSIEKLIKLKKKDKLDEHIAKSLEG
ncbi:hypothetical protein NBRC110019_20650 [Neptunitalea chrysea]|uniref:Uncharacterized protein n=1 Tax=Neptunitalea chrysea TaxID=1647581 RepID=A0A9W6B7J1_9FLAO|nr:hypothetical protein [Neptunitalea chrysea]GLB53025.1 hypothetical protein NBRC110019_20650 [Neptunitalea chrysea]